MKLNVEKLRSAMLFIAAHPSVEDVGTTKLYKLVYFSDARHLRETGSTITGSEYIKYEHGPVPSRGEKAVKQLRSSGAISITQVLFGDYVLNRITALEQPAATTFTDHELDSLRFVCETLGKLSAKRLSELSHHEPAWVNAGYLEKLRPELMAYGSSEDPEGL